MTQNSCVRCEQKTSILNQGFCGMCYADAWDRNPNSEAERMADRARRDANLELNNDATIDPVRYEDELLKNLSLYQREWICNRCGHIRLTVNKQESNSYPTLSERLMKPCKKCQAVGYLQIV